jgi:hypothetical protein
MRNRMMGQRCKRPGDPTQVSADLLLLSAFVFLIIYNISFKFNESMSTARLAVLGLMLWSFARRLSPISVINRRIMLMFLPVPYVALQYAFVPDFGQLSRFLHLFLYSVLGAALVATIARDIRTVLRAILIAVTVQSFLLIFSFFSLEYRAWFGALAATGSNYDVLNYYRAPGFSSVGGSSLSVTQSLGVLVGWLMLRKDPRYAAASGWPSYLVLLSMFLAMASCIVVGRTGLILSGIFFLMFFVSTDIRFGRVLFVLVACVAVYVFSAYFFTRFVSADFSTDYFLNWVTGFLSGDDETASVLAEMPIPRLSSDTFFGTGLSSVINDANPSGNDSGFIQAYYSMGIVCAAMLYTAYFYVLCYALRWLPIRLRVMLAVAFFAIEGKEPFMFKYGIVFVLLALHFSFVLSKRQRLIRSGSGE